VGTATVGIFWIGNLLSWGPLYRARHLVFAAQTDRCPRCGLAIIDGLPRHGSERCSHEVSFVAEVDPARVAEEAVLLFMQEVAERAL
jgi:hypothetical protein